MIKLKDLAQYLPYGIEVEITNGNKLIAEFMGRVANPNDGGITYTEGLVFYDEKGEMIGADGFSNPIYNKSWDWLMPVVEKIESIWIGHSQPRCKIEGTYCQIADDDGYYARNSNLNKDNQLGGEYFVNNYTKLENTYRMVIYFINWYNSNK